MKYRLLCFMLLLPLGLGSCIKKDDAGDLAETAVISEAGEESITDDLSASENALPKEYEGLGEIQIKFSSSNGTYYTWIDDDGNLYKGLYQYDDFDTYDYLYIEASYVSGVTDEFGKEVLTINSLMRAEYSEMYINENRKYSKDISVESGSTMDTFTDVFYVDDVYYDDEYTYARIRASQAQEEGYYLMAGYVDYIDTSWYMAGNVDYYPDTKLFEGDLWLFEDYSSAETYARTGSYSSDPTNAEDFYDDSGANEGNISPYFMLPYDNCYIDSNTGLRLISYTHVNGCPLTVSGFDYIDYQKGNLNFVGKVRNDGSDILKEAYLEVKLVDEYGNTLLQRTVMNPSIYLAKDVYVKYEPDPQYGDQGRMSMYLTDASGNILKFTPEPASDIDSIYARNGERAVMKFFINPNEEIYFCLNDIDFYTDYYHSTISTDIKGIGTPVYGIYVTVKHYGY